LTPAQRRVRMRLMSWMQETPDGVVVSLRVVPRASKDTVQGVLGEALKIRLQAPPVEGKANEALVRFLSKTLDVPARDVCLLSGATGRAKRVLVKGLKAQIVRDRLSP
jgi:uncharacterized protein